MSDNPLLKPPRETVVELWPGDIERKVHDLETALDEAVGKEEVWVEEQRTKGAKRAAGPKNPHTAEADKIAAEIDEAAAGVTPRRLVFREPRARDVRQVRDEHPPRKGNQGDELVGVNTETFYVALGEKCIVEPEVTPAQWAEFADNCSEYDWRKIVKALDELSATEVSVPKFSAVSALTARRQRVSRQRAVSE